MNAARLLLAKPLTGTDNRPWYDQPAQPADGGTRTAQPTTDGCSAERRAGSGHTFYGLLGAAEASDLRCRHHSSGKPWRARMARGMTLRGGQEFRDALPVSPVGRVHKFRLRAEGRTPATWDRLDSDVEVARR